MSTPLATRRPTARTATTAPTSSTVSTLALDAVLTGLTSREGA